MNQTVFNLVNVIMGAGYVSIPFALKQGGWAALGVLWLLGLVFCWTGVVLLQCCRYLEQQAPSPTSTTNNQQQQHPKALLPYTATYEDLAAAAFGAAGRQLVSGVMYAELLGICCVYIVLEVGPPRVVASSGCGEEGGGVGSCLCVVVGRRRGGAQLLGSAFAPG
jgi:vesicular inhibitory amino acid transporter